MSLVNTFPQAFLEVLHHSLQHGEIAATSSLMFCFKSTVVLGFFRTRCSWAIPRVRNRRRWDRAILQAIQYSFLVRSSELGTSRWGPAVQSSHCEPLPRLDETREYVFQHQVSATPVPEMCEASQCSGLIYCCYPACLVFKEIGADHPKRCYTTPNNNLLRM